MLFHVSKPKKRDSALISSFDVGIDFHFLALKTHIIVFVFSHSHVKIQTSFLIL